MLSTESERDREMGEEEGREAGRGDREEGGGRGSRTSDHFSVTNVEGEGRKDREEEREGKREGGKRDTYFMPPLVPKQSDGDHGSGIGHCAHALSKRVGAGIVQMTSPHVSSEVAWRGSCSSKVSYKTSRHMTTTL